MITVSAFKWVPPFAQGYVRDLRVRWALEEAALPYEERLLGANDLASADYRALQPFGQVPAFEEDGKTLFESGAIVLHIAERSPALSPAEPHARARVMTWVFAALCSLEPFVQNMIDVDVFNAEEAWAKARRPQVLARLDERLRALAAHLGARSHLEDRFTAGDLVMTAVLRDLPDGILPGYPTLKAYRERCEDRPAFQRALAAQLATFARYAPKA